MSNPTTANFSQDQHPFNDSSPALPQQLYQQNLQQPNRMVYQNQLLHLPSQMLDAPAKSMNYFISMSGTAPHSMILLSGDANPAATAFHPLNAGNLQFQQLQVSNFNPTSSCAAPEQQLQQPRQPDILKSFMDQKLQQAHFEDQWRQRLVSAPADPLTQSPFIGDAGLLMGPNPLMFGLNQGAIHLPSPHQLSFRDDTRRMRGGVIEPFPEKLHRLLLEVEQAGRSDVISFIANGQAFAIHKPDKFFKQIVPKYFRQSRLSSFKRQLNLYGFELINTGPARGGYYHEMFIKDRAELCRRMRRVAVKLSQQDEKQKNQDDTQMSPDLKLLPLLANDNEISTSTNHSTLGDSMNRTSAMSA
jgi:hypothetical protein